jgi:hypothetical protein
MSRNRTRVAVTATQNNEDVTSDRSPHVPSRADARDLLPERGRSPQTAAAAPDCDKPPRKRRPRFVL